MLSSLPTAGQNSRIRHYLDQCGASVLAQHNRAKRLHYVFASAAYLGNISEACHVPMLFAIMNGSVAVL